MIARYLVFAGSVFYPNGGMQDLYSSHDQYLDAFESAVNYDNGNRSGRWSEIYDTVQMKTIERFHSMRLNEEFEFNRNNENET